MTYVERKEYNSEFIKSFINDEDLVDLVSAWVDVDNGYGMLVDMLEDDTIVSTFIDEIGEDGETYEISSSENEELDIFIYKVNDKNYMFAIKNSQALVIWNK